MNSSGKAWVRALEQTAAIEHDVTRTLPSLVDEWAERFGHSPALVSHDVTLSYASLASCANRYSRWALREGLVPGDVVCLFMRNHPQYMAIWLGLARIGVTVALVNTNLTGEPLAHAVAAVAPRGIIVGHSLSAVAAVAVLPPTMRYWSHGAGESQWAPIDEAAMRLSGERLSRQEFSAPSLRDRALYIYTSGTTGLPKAAIVTHFRLMQWSHWFAGLMDTRADDRMYNCLPMYHSIGGVVATGAPMLAGGTVVLRERFSTSKFWEDIRTERCTLFQYIGELCRYLLASPSTPDETQHALRLCCGNGLREDVWIEFQRRFRVAHILEYYASTEGSFSLYNCEEKPGSIGRIPPFLRHRMPVALVRFDPECELPVRDAAGRCVRCEPDEVGEAIAEVANPTGKVVLRFEGYTDPAASAKKVLRDVFVPGDAWYRTGDLMRTDPEGFFYFVDRVGDTYRWKGENVSTAEVSAAIARCRGIQEAAVYGTRVPGTEGRAGMAALVLSNDFSLGQLHAELGRRLPDYARPLFLRIVSALEVTGTFKLRKQDLANDGFDPMITSDALYFDDRTAGEYVRLDRALYDAIVTGQVRI